MILGPTVFYVAYPAQRPLTVTLTVTAREDIYISTCRGEQCRQGGDNWDNAEIQTVGRETEEDKR